MTPEESVHRRVLRRETHAPRTAPAVVVAVVLIVLLLAAGTAVVWILVDRGLGETVAGARDTALADPGTPMIVAAAGIALVIVAIVLVALAIAPGRRGRRGRIDDRVALLVDDEVIADAAADRIASDCGVDRDRVVVTVGRKRLHAEATPVSGVPLAEGAVRDCAAAAVRELGFELAVSARIAERGVVS